MPQTFVLPHDLSLLKKAWDEESSKHKWIVKPVSCFNLHYLTFVHLGP